MFRLAKKEITIQYGYIAHVELMNESFPNTVAWDSKNEIRQRNERKRQAEKVKMERSKVGKSQKLCYSEGLQFLRGHYYREQWMNYLANITIQL